MASKYWPYYRYSGELVVDLYAHEKRWNEAVLRQDELNQKWEKQHSSWDKYLIRLKELQVAAGMAESARLTQQRLAQPRAHDEWADDVIKRADEYVASGQAHRLQDLWKEWETRFGHRGLYVHVYEHLLSKGFTESNTVRFSISQRVPPPKARVESSNSSLQAKLSDEIKSPVLATSETDRYCWAATAKRIFRLDRQTSKVAHVDLPDGVRLHPRLIVSHAQSVFVGFVGNSNHGGLLQIGEEMHIKILTKNGAPRKTPGSLLLDGRFLWVTEDLGALLVLDTVTGNWEQAMGPAPKGRWAQLWREAGKVYVQSGAYPGSAGFGDRLTFACSKIYGGAPQCHRVSPPPKLLCSIDGTEWYARSRHDTKWRNRITDDGVWAQSKRHGWKQTFGMKNGLPHIGGVRWDGEHLWIRGEVNNRWEWYAVSKAELVRVAAELTEQARKGANGDVLAK